MHSFFFFNDPATTEISTLPLPNALPISRLNLASGLAFLGQPDKAADEALEAARLQPTAFIYSEWTDRKSTRLNSSHQIISYAVFCLKKKNNITLLLTISIDKTQSQHALA